MRSVRYLAAAAILAMPFLAASLQEVLGDQQPAPALEVPTSSAARKANIEGIKHYKEGHMDVAANYFRQAAKADPQSAEAHYNLALALDGLGDHMAAAKTFERALTLGAGNPAIADSAILQRHLNKGQLELITQH
ncbi:MAG: tetratricopeptide repeat protein [Nitrospirota bacterium]